MTHVWAVQAPVGGVVASQLVLQPNKVTIDKAQYQPEEAMAPAEKKAQELIKQKIGRAHV